MLSENSPHWCPIWPRTREQPFASSLSETNIRDYTRHPARKQGKSHIFAEQRPKFAAIRIWAQLNLPIDKRKGLSLRRIVAMAGNSPFLLSVAAMARRNYFKMLLTTPAPTVRPPSRIAKRVPSSSAIGAISSTSIVTLSPGITISVPSGSFTTPVTSVVRK
jgi:hypothetical protein